MILQTKTRQQLADEFGISRRTLYKWLKKLSIDSRTLLTPKELQFIYEVYGLPPIPITSHNCSS